MDTPIFSKGTLEIQQKRPDSMSSQTHYRGRLFLVEFLQLSENFFKQFVLFSKVSVDSPRCKVESHKNVFDHTDRHKHKTKSKEWILPAPFQHGFSSVSPIELTTLENNTHLTNCQYDGGIV